MKFMFHFFVFIRAVVLSDNIGFPVFGLEDIIDNHTEISKTIWTKVKSDKKYNEYIETGRQVYIRSNIYSLSYSISNFSGMLIKIEKLKKTLALHRIF